MARNTIPPEYMTVSELAKCMGLDRMKVMNELRIDSRRDIKQYPFAITIHNEKTNTWQYRVHRKRFEAWERGELSDVNQLATILETLVEKIINKEVTHDAIF